MRGVALLLALAAGAEAVHAQSAAPWEARASHVIVPQARAFNWDARAEGIRIESVRAEVEILEQTARTTLELRLVNPGARPAEAVVVLPVPRGAAVSGFAFEGASSEPTAVLLRADEARRTYDEIVNRLKDPGLLEFAGFDLVRSSLFPVPANGRQRARITYEHLLERDGDRVDYALPRSESLVGCIPWELAAEVRAKRPISTLYSPTHALDVTRRDARHLSVRLAGGTSSAPGPLLLSYLLERQEGVSASLFAYPDPEVGGGFFLLMAGLPASLADAERELRREVTVVLDRSGSMAGEKLDQARAAALQVIEGLADGEAFNVVDYSSQVASFAPAPVVKDERTKLAARDYLASLRPGGGTNVHDALLEALRQDARPGMLPIVLFLTDGLPTVGRTSELDVRRMVEQANVHQRRIFTFGVGHDVNVPLLDRLSDQTRATSTYVLPGEDVELAVAKVFRRLYGPVLASPRLEALDERGALTTRAVRELAPDVLPDLYEGDQLVVLGQYAQEGPLRFRLKADFLGQERAFTFAFDVKPTTRNAFVPRLWAARRIAFLADQIRQAGAALTGAPVPSGASLFTDPRFAELANEILRLSTKYGVLSEYTAFLATEGTELGDWDRLVEACNSSLDAQAVRTRSGEAAVNQGKNFNERKLASQVDYGNNLWNAKSERVELAGVQQVCDRAFFARGRRWIDGSLVGADASQVPDEVVLFGSERHREILGALVLEGRQGLLSLPGEILFRYDGRNVLVRNEAVADGAGR